MEHVDTELIVLVLFWAVVVVALLLTTTAREVRATQYPETFGGGENSASAPVEPAAANVVPLRHPQSWPPGTHRAHHASHRSTLKDGPSRIRAS